MSVDTTLSPHSQLITLIDGLPNEQAELLIPLLRDLIEVSREENGLASVDRNYFRESMDLPRILPQPTITPLAGVLLAGLEVSFEDQVTGSEHEVVHDNLTKEHFPLTLPAGPRTLVLAHFDTDTDIHEVRWWAKSNGYEPALIDDLLAIRNHPKHREAVYDFPVLAIGSCSQIDEDAYVPSLSSGDLDLEPVTSGFYDLYRFLLVTEERAIPSP